MNRRAILVVFAVLVVVSLVVVGLLVAGFGATVGVDGGVVGADAKDPELLAFETGDVHCLGDDDYATNGSTVVEAGGANTEITYARNVSLPDSRSSIGTATFERLNDSVYVLSVPFEQTEDAARSCSGVVRYNGTVRLPAGDDPWTLVVEHDGETVATLSGDANSSALSASASVSGSASGGSATNTTTAETTSA